MLSIAITPRSNISQGCINTYFINVPCEKLSFEEQNVWLKAAMQIYSSCPSDDNNNNDKSNNEQFTTIDSLVYAFKFALNGTGRFKEYTTLLPNNQ